MLKCEIFQLHDYDYVTCSVLYICISILLSHAFARSYSDPIVSNIDLEANGSGFDAQWKSFIFNRDQSVNAHCFSFS